jgi:Bacterial regulatory proteins, gntR family
MRQLAYALPALPGFDSPKTFAAWPVWRDSPDAESVRFVPLPKKEAARRWHKARRFDRQTHTPGKHGGTLGRSGLAVLYVLLFDFLDYATGQLDPSYDTIAAKAGVARRTVAAALRRLKAAGLLHWQRRSREDKEAAGGFRRVQETNAYAVLPPSHWRGYHEPPPPPPPEPGTWGDHPPLPDPITQAMDELRHGQRRTALDLLGCDPGDDLAASLGRLGRAIFGPQV